MSRLQNQSWWFFLALNAPGFSLSMVHLINNPNLYHYVLTRFIDRGLLDEHRLNTALGTLGIVGLLVATMIQPAVGLLSDRTRTRYPYLFVGILISTLALLIVANAETWGILISSIIILQIGLNTIQSPMQALIPDYVRPSQRGVAASLKTVLELAGIVMSGVVVFLFLGNHTRPALAVAVSGFGLLVATLISIRSIAGKVAAFSPRQKSSLIKRYTGWYAVSSGSRTGAQISLYRLSVWHIFRRRPLLWWLASRFMFYSCFNTLGKFGITYLTDVFGYSGEEARSLQGVILLATGILVFVVTLIGGWVADQLGKKQVAAAGSIVASAATLVLINAPGLTLAVIAICVIGMGSGIFFSAGWALITNIVPSRRAGFYLGLANVATTLGGIFGLLGGYLIDAINDRASEPAAGYSVLFGIIMVLFAFSAYATIRIREPQSQ